ncbi:MAG: hypothetical protein MUO38_07675 [Anaerolineales bacterium]|nr:hypothetical protein [Anaerolineales bacterium]
MPSNAIPQGYKGFNVCACEVREERPCGIGVVNDFLHARGYLAGTLSGLDCLILGLLEDLVKA